MKTFVSVARFSLFALVAFASPHVFAVIDSGATADGCYYVIYGDGNVTLVCSSGGGGSGFDSGGGGFGGGIVVGGGGGGGAVAAASMSTEAIFAVIKTVCKKSNETCTEWGQRMVSQINPTDPPPQCTTLFIASGQTNVSNCRAAVTLEVAASACVNIPDCPTG